MVDAAVTETRDRVLSGILLTSVAYLLFSAQDASIKLLVTSISVWQILFLRSTFILIGCAAAGGPDLFRDAARSPIFFAMLIRSLIILVAWICFYSAARHLQLAELTTIYFAAPVIVTILSVLILGEDVPLFRWIAVAVGFAGVFVACDPARLGLSMPVVLVLTAAFLWALSIVLLRKIALNERTSIQLVINNGFLLLVAGIPLVMFWQTPNLQQLALLVLVGMFGGIAQFMLFEGMKRAAASVIGPFEYTSLVWSFVFGYLIWRDVPRVEVFFGAALIALAGIIMIAGERFLRR